MSRRGERGAADVKGMDSESSSEYPTDDDYAWIPWFCSLEGNEFFCMVDDQYVQDSFNLTDLPSKVVYYEHALDMILDVNLTDEILSDDQQDMIENDAEILYGLIHARFILSNRGLHAMLAKFRDCEFGTCPRVLCHGQPVLPTGLSDTLNEQSVKLYCPRCEQVYNSKSSRHEHMDGAFIGTTFANLFFLTFPDLKPKRAPELYVPKLFGFRLHAAAHARALEAKKVLASRSADKKRRVRV